MHYRQSQKGNLALLLFLYLEASSECGYVLGACILACRILVVSEDVEILTSKSL